MENGYIENLLDVEEDKWLDSLDEASVLTIVDNMKNHIIPMCMHMIKYKNQPSKQGSSWVTTIVNEYENIQRIYRNIDRNNIQKVRERINEYMPIIYSTAKSEACAEMRMNQNNISDDYSDMDFDLFVDRNRLHRWMVENLADKPFNSAIDAMNKDYYKEKMGTTIMDSDGIYNKNEKRIIIRR